MEFVEWIAWDSFKFEKASHVYGYSLHVLVWLFIWFAWLIQIHWGGLYLYSENFILLSVWKGFEALFS